jgi:hypothetical protein
MGCSGSRKIGSAAGASSICFIGCTSDGRRDLEPRLPMIYPPDIPIEVCDKFIELAREVKRAGMKHYSADAILHRIRWHFIIEQRRGKFKVNNNWTSNLARWAMTYHQDLAGFFNTRASPQQGSDHR